MSRQATSAGFSPGISFTILTTSSYGGTRKTSNTTGTAAIRNFHRASRHSLATFTILRSISFAIE